MTDTVYHAGQQVLGFGIRQFPEPKGIERSNRPCSHGKDVPVNTTHARSCTLKRFNSRRVIVGFYLKNDAESIPDIHDTRILLPGLH